MRSARARAASVFHGPLGRGAVIFLLAFAIRALLLTKIPEEYIRPGDRWEIEAIAMSLAREGEFADPYAIPTGPTAHVPPIYPALIALLYRLLGISLSTGYVRWLLDIAAVSMASAILPWLALRFGLTLGAGTLAGLAGALALRWLTAVEDLAAILLALLLIALERAWSEERGPVPAAFAIGLGFGIAFHLKPELLAVLFGCAVFDLWWRRRRPRWILSAAALLAGALVACVPWGVRNWRTFHAPLFVRSNLGLELRVGNHPGATADIDAAPPDTLRHPREDLGEARRVAELGEIRYMRAAGAEALAWIRAHPSAYAGLTIRRFLGFWLGSWHDPLPALAAALTTALALLGARRVVPGLTIPQRAALLIPLATFPLVYYFVIFMPRYRIPVDWIL
ncbi:MAG TPA: hypothetical protein VGF40_10765, partial [Thermoanaerobaculia bacterium]